MWCTSVWIDNSLFVLCCFRSCSTPIPSRKNEKTNPTQLHKSARMPIAMELHCSCAAAPRDIYRFACRMERFTATPLWFVTLPLKKALNSLFSHSMPVPTGHTFAPKIVCDFTFATLLFHLSLHERIFSRCGLQQPLRWLFYFFSFFPFIAFLLFSCCLLVYSEFLFFFGRCW